MRYRALDANGDYSGGRGQGNFLINSPACVAQSVLTRLKLWQGEWFLDLTAGTPWLQKVLGKNSKKTYDLAIRARVLGTQGVTAITSYSSTLDTAKRILTVSIEIMTQFGSATVETALTPTSSN
jgi:hypothetical protein